MRRIPLPTNPNCVVFPAAASDVLVERTWSMLLGVAARATQHFYADSGIDATAMFAWRVSQDRRNHRQHQVTLLFLFDGPAKARSLGVLEDNVASSAVFLDESSIERVPPHAVPGVCTQSGALNQLLVEVDGRPVVRALTLTPRGVVMRDLPNPGPEVLLEDVRCAIATPPDYSEVDETLEKMRLMFARHYTQRIIEADGIVQEDELQFMAKVFPDGLLAHFDLQEAARQQEWLEEAELQLVHRLGHHDKLALVGLFFSACYSDGVLDAREMRVLREAGESLGLTRQQVVKYLQRFW